MVNSGRMTCDHEYATVEGPHGTACQNCGAAVVPMGPELAGKCEEALKRLPTGATTKIRGVQPASKLVFVAGMLLTPDEARLLVG